MRNIKILAIAIFVVILITPCFAADWAKTFKVGSVSGNTKLDIKFMPGDKCVLSLDSNKYNNGNYISCGSVSVAFNAYDENNNFFGSYRVLLTSGFNGKKYNGDKCVKLPLNDIHADKKISYYKPVIIFNVCNFDCDSNDIGSLTVSLSKN